MTVCFSSRCSSQLDDSLYLSFPGRTRDAITTPHRVNDRPLDDAGAETAGGRRSDLSIDCFSLMTIVSDSRNSHVTNSFQGVLNNDCDYDDVTGAGSVDNETAKTTTQR
jgi:hypothetical protein